MAANQPAIWVALLWLLREIISLALKQSANRSGRIGCNTDKCGFYNLVVTKDGDEVLARFFPSAFCNWKDSVPLTITAELFNDTKTPVMLNDFNLDFWGVNGLKITHRHPKIYSRDQLVNTLRIPAHDSIPISLVEMLPLDRLDEVYMGTIPLLQMSDVHGRTKSFRVGKCSFYGDCLVVWPSKKRRYPRYPKDYPIYNKKKLNPTYTWWECVLVNLGIRPHKPNKVFKAPKG